MIDFDKIGKYKVTGKLGQGSFGVVYRGRDAYLKRDVAIKVCSVEDEGLRRRFFREAEISGKLVHRNIVTVYEFGFETDIPYLVQEMLSGEDLSRIVKRRDLIAPAVKLDYLLQVANGLGYAHTEGVIHRDIKPGNIRALEDGRIKIMDFGIAKLASAETQLTQKGVTMGTASYLPPEQVRGAELDHRADVFSFGVLGYELLSFERPFRGNTLSALIYQILYKKPRPMSDVWPECPPQLSELVAKCLEKNPERRYRSFAELIPELSAVRKDVLAGRWPALQAAAPPAADGQSVAPEAGKPVETEARKLDETSDVLSQSAIAETARSVLEGRVGDYTISTAASPQEVLRPTRTEAGRSTRPIAVTPAATTASDAALKTRILAKPPDLPAPGALPATPSANSEPQEAPSVGPPPGESSADPLPGESSVDPPPGELTVRPPSGEPEELTFEAKKIIDLVAQGKLEAEAAKAQLEATFSKQDLTGISTMTTVEIPANEAPVAPAPPLPLPDAKSDTYRTFFRPPLGRLQWAGIAAGTVAVAGLGWLVLRDGNPAVEPAPEPPPPVPIVQPAVTEPALGAVAINATPWAELTEITDVQGYVQELPQSVHTPLFLELPPGQYKIHLQAPESLEVQTCDLEVALEAVASCAPVFGEPSVTEYFKETGWWF